MDEAKLTVIMWVLAGPLPAVLAPPTAEAEPPEAESLLSLLLTCKVRDLAMQLRKTSRIPMSLGVTASEDDLAKMPKSLGGNWAIPRRLASVWGRTSGKILLKRAITCLNKEKKGQNPDSF